MPVKSPCIGRCEMAAGGPARGLCLGCYRNLDEIAGWSTAPEAARLAILAQVAQRRAGLPADAALPCDQGVGR